MVSLKVYLLFTSLSWQIENNRIIEQAEGSPVKFCTTEKRGNSQQATKALSVVNLQWMRTPSLMIHNIKMIIRQISASVETLIQQIYHFRVAQVRLVVIRISLISTLAPSSVFVRAIYLFEASIAATTWHTKPKQTCCSCCRFIYLTQTSCNLHCTLFRSKTDNVRLMLIRKWPSTTTVRSATLFSLKKRVPRVLCVESIWCTMLRPISLQYQFLISSKSV